MFTRLLTSALFAGAASGLIAALLQLWFVQPVLLHAELYEGGELVHFGATSTVSAIQDVGGFEAVRDGLSIVFTMLIYSAYAMIVVAVMSVAEERGAVINVRTGMIWGIAGFIAVHLAPGFSLQPAVAGVASADVGARQIWWFTTVGMAAVAMALIGFGKSWPAVAGAAVLLLAPHVYGAPRPDVFTGPVPTEIGALFAVRALGVGLAAWVLLGALSGYFWSRKIGVTGEAQSV